MTNDNIPSSDPAFHNWVGPFAGFVSTNATAWGLDPAVVTPLTNAVATWTTAYPAHGTAQRASFAASKTKKQARAALEGVARPLIQSLQTNSKVTDAQRKQMKINVRTTKRSRVAVPTTAPQPVIDTSQRLRHIVNYVDSTFGGGKPAGVSYCEIWAKIGGPAPTDESQLVYLGNATKSPQLEEFSATQAGQMVWYWLRWVNTRGEFGPWSVQVSATIPG